MELGPDYVASIRKQSQSRRLFYGSSFGCLSMVAGRSPYRATLSQGPRASSCGAILDAPDASRCGRGDDRRDLTPYAPRPSARDPVLLADQKRLACFRRALRSRGQRSQDVFVGRFFRRFDPRRSVPGPKTAPCSAPSGRAFRSRPDRKGQMVRRTARARRSAPCSLAAFFGTQD
jgi:hypothetical protein